MDSATVTREDAGKDIPVAKLAVASTIGTIIEAYDFVLYGTVAALVFDKLFFPDATPLVATLASFATFGVGFLARPVGGAIFGHYGDKVGRKKMLVLALVIMGVATMADRRAAGLQLDRHLGSDPAGRAAPDPGRRARRRVGRRGADGHRVRAQGQARLLRLVAADRLRRRPRDLHLDHLDHVDVAERLGVRELGLARAVLRVRSARRGRPLHPPEDRGDPRVHRAAGEARAREGAGRSRSSRSTRRTCCARSACASPRTSRSTC